MSSVEQYQDKIESETCTAEERTAILTATLSSLINMIVDDLGI